MFFFQCLNKANIHAVLVVNLFLRIIIVSRFPPLKFRGIKSNFVVERPGGVLKVYMTGGGGGGWGSDGASYWKSKKIHKPEILDPKKYLALKFPTQKQGYKCTLYCLLNINSFFGTQVAEKKFE